MSVALAFATKMYVCEVSNVFRRFDGKPVNPPVGQKTLEHSHALGKKVVSLFSNILKL